MKIFGPGGGDGVENLAEVGSLNFQVLGFDVALEELAGMLLDEAGELLP